MRMCVQNVPTGDKRDTRRSTTTGGGKITLASQQRLHRRLSNAPWLDDMRGVLCTPTRRESIATAVRRQSVLDRLGLNHGALNTDVVPPSSILKTPRVLHDGKTCDSAHAHHFAQLRLLITMTSYRNRFGSMCR
jgi:hypothetical protein